MTGISHQLVALLAAFWILTIYPVSVGPGVATLMIIAVMVGALTPDLDQPTADLWRRLLGARTLGTIFNSFSGGHRHFTHSVIGIAIIGWLLRQGLLAFSNPVYHSALRYSWLAFMIGYVSHSVADTVTDRGVPWLWPLRWHLRIPPGPVAVRVTTNSWVERLLVRGGLLVALGLLLTRYWPLLTRFFSSPILS